MTRYRPARIVLPLTLFLAVFIGCSRINPERKLVGLWEHDLNVSEIAKVNTNQGPQSIARLDETVYNLMVLQNEEEQFKVGVLVFFLKDTGQSPVLQLHITEDKTCKIAVSNTTAPGDSLDESRTWDVISTHGGGFNIRLSRTGKTQARDFLVTFEGNDKITVSPAGKSASHGMAFFRRIK